MPTAELKNQIVVIGCSSSGIDILLTLVASLPSPFPAPIIIAQHVEGGLDGKRPADLANILPHRCALPIRTISEPAVLEPGVVYVVPPGRDVEINEQTGCLVPEGSGQPRLSIDVLFQSAANAFGENLFAILLMGTRLDGAAGARQVKKCGGTVIIESPGAASVAGTPEALEPTAIDIMASVDRIGRILYDLLVRSDEEPPPDEEQQLQDLLDTVRERSGIDFKKYKQATIWRRLRRRIVVTETGTAEKYIRYLGEHPEEYQRLINSFLINVTEFMRDAEIFAYLRDTILPELIERARQEGKTLRIWSAGCATGEEAYSLAILVSEILGDELDDFTVRIFSTDIDSEAIAFARRGIYTPSSVNALRPELVERYFVAVDGHYQIKKRVRNLTVFGEHDLGQRAPFPQVDLVVCRNVLIYFTSELQRRTLQLFAFSLRSNGYLLLGKAESTSPLSEFFVAHESRYKVYARRGERVLIPPTRFEPLPPKRVFRRGSRPLLPSQHKEASRVRMPLDALLLSLPIGAVLVDNRYDIVEINFAARRLLGVHGLAVGQDFVHLVQAAPHRALLDAIDAVFHGDTPGPIEVAVESVASEEPRYIQITCHPQHPDSDVQKRDCAVILISDVTEVVRQRRALERANSGLAKAEAQITELTVERAAERARLNVENEGLRRENEDLRAVARLAEASQKQEQTRANQITDAHRRLLRANEELSMANEQLRSANEELMLSSEEAQAATEEVETLNEELQATNEELETLNEELQSTIEELNTTNADLEVRSREIQELAAPIEAERARLSAILRSMGDGLLVVDGTGKPILRNDAYQQMFGSNRIALTDESGRLLGPEETPERRAARGERFQMEFSVPVPGGASRHFEALGQPIAAFPSNAQEGGVIVIRDITERSIRKLQDRFLAMASHELRTPLVPLHGYLDMLLALLPDTESNTRLRRFAELARTQADRLEKLVDDLVNATRIQTGKFKLKLEPLELGPLLARAVELARVIPESRPVHGDGLDGAQAPLVVSGDGGRLEQVVMNLLTNAFRYADGTPHVDLRLRRAGDSAEIEIQDYGPGIPEAAQVHLFSSFYQVERVDRPTKGGMGLGLYICKEIINAHGGEISVNSAEGKGTKFTVQLPLLRRAEAS